jgi:NADPH-dependent 2,4-dienoyl-CoA reductase/sulfur reductase-like enzyme/nitrite reductase/ring-hydroxylating ferredoxin subunit
LGVTSQEHDVAGSADLPDGTMEAVTAGETTVLLARIQGTVHAVGGRCPHAGGPLAEGVLCGERVICPWHKAAFSVVSGARLDPPAVDPLPHFAVREANGRIFVTVPPEEDAPQTPGDDDPRCFVIVGGGAAGSSAAQELREQGFAGQIVMLDRENRVPYDRTLLSKYYLSGEKGGEKTPLQKQSWYPEKRIERVTADVTRLDPAARTIACADGNSFRYDAALVATGGTPRRPKLPGIDLRGVFTLRSRADAEAILAAAERARRAVVVGSGFIGMEVAASLRERGLEVTVVADETEPFESKLGPEVGAVFRRLHEAKGVEFRLRSKVAAFEGDGALRAVQVEGGGRLEADLAVIGSGITPLTGFLAGGIERDKHDAIVVDRMLRAADALYAAGDIASYPLMGDGKPIRVEHWRVAQQHGRIAARNMLGRGDAYDAVPVFWTIQYMKRLDYVGHATEWDHIAVDGELDPPDFLAFYVRDGRVAAVAGFDRDSDMAALILLMQGRTDWTPEGLRAVLEAGTTAVCGQAQSP